MSRLAVDILHISQPLRVLHQRFVHGEHPLFQLNKVGISIVIQAQHIAQTAASARQFQFVIVGFLGLQVSVGQYDERWPRAIILEKLLLRVGHTKAGRELIRRVEPLAVGIRSDDQERNTPFGVADGREIHSSTLHVLQ